MATQSLMLELGVTAPDFALPDPKGKTYSLADIAAGKPFLVAFICNHCPYVKHLLPALPDFAREYKAKGLNAVAISTNDAANYPDDAPDKMALTAQKFDFAFPYLYDEAQAVARAYKAVCTPDFFLFDANKKLVYRGQFDATRPGRGMPDGADLHAAADAVLAGRAPAAEQKPSVGCSIKWKAGNAPDWA